MVEEVVVGDVDEELSGGRMRIVRAGHRDRVLVVLQAVVGFVLDRIVGGLLLHARFKAAALNHEALDHAVEDRAVVEARLHIVFEVFAGDRSVFGIKFNVDDAEIGSEANHLRIKLVKSKCALREAPSLGKADFCRQAA